MTTPARARLYAAQHMVEQEGKARFVFNPNGREIQDLPSIFAFSNVSGGGDGRALAMAEDGHVLGSHWCSSEVYVPYDLGVLEDTRDDRQADYKKHYPEGFKMVFVLSSEVLSHEGLSQAFKLNAQLKESSAPEEREFAIPHDED